MQAQNHQPGAGRLSPAAAARLDHDSDRIPFCGITNESPFPTTYRKIAGVEHGSRGESVPTFVSVIEWLNEHYRQERRPVAYWDQERDGWVQTKRHVALVNPAWEGDGLSEYADAVTHTSVPGDACWHIPTGSYGIVNPIQAYAPLLAVLKKHDSGPVFGHIERYRNTGEVSIDIFLPNYAVKASRSAKDRYVLGINTGYSYYGDKRHYARIIAFDTEKRSVLRGLTEKRARRHVRQQTRETAARDVGAWWDGTIGRLGRAADALFTVVVNARTYIFDFTTSSFDVRTLYESMGFPEAHIDVALSQYLDQNVTKADAYTLFDAMTQVFTHDYGGKTTGSTLLGHVNRANKLLYNPARVHAEVLNHVESELRGQQTLGEDREERLEALAVERETALKSVQRLEESRTRLRTVLKEADVAEDDAEDEDGDDDE